MTKTDATPNQLSEDRKPTTAHLEDLRSCIVRSGLAIGIGFIAGYLLSDLALNGLIQPILKHVDQIHFFAPTDAFVVKLKVSLLLGLIFASPIVIHQLWKFISPGLYSKEKKAALPWTLLCLVLFLSGVSFAFFVVIPVALGFLIGFETPDLSPMISVNRYVSFVSTMILAFGIAFNLPTAMMLLTFLKLVKPNTFAKYRRHAYVFILVLSMALTPPDVASQLLLGLPLVILYEMSILGSRLLARVSSKENVNQK